MPRFLYKAKKGPHEIVDGTVEAKNIDNAIEKINQIGYIPIDIVLDTKKEPKKQPREKTKFLFNIVRSIRSSDVGLFTRQLGDLVSAGVPLLRALNVIVNQTENPSLKNIVKNMYSYVQDGGSLSSSLAQHPSVFSDVYVNMVKAGEMSGKLDVVLERLAEFSEKDEETRTKISSSLIYPALILIVGFLTIFIMLAFIIPRLTVMFDDISEALPVPTVILMAVSDFLGRFWWVIVGLIIFIVASIKKYYRSNVGRFKIDKIMLQIPILGKCVYDAEMGRFARTLGTLLKSGVTVVLALDAVWAVLSNAVLKDDLKMISQEVLGGSSLTAALKKSKYFPEMAVNMIAVGEESGHLEASLHKLANSYEKQSDRSVKTITSLLEPLLIVFIGSIIGCVVIALLLPILMMNSIVQ